LKPKDISKTTGQKRTRRRALSPEAREQQLIALAIDLAEQQLMDGTASSQVITHYLKLGSSKERKDLEKAEAEIELMKARIKSLERDERIEDLFRSALDSFKVYSGQTVTAEDEGVEF
jgi:hypothetical protein